MSVGATIRKFAFVTMKQVILAISILSMLCLACKKEPGQGGKASIQGDITVMDYDQTFKTLNGTYPGADRWVYIIYGDNVSYNDKVKTSFEGVYEFKYLNRGDYTIYTYSKDSTLQAPSGEVAVIKELEITDKKQVVQVPEMIVFE